MKIVQYCQHVLGVGHFFRTLEICRALSDHDVILLTGGAAVDVPLPDHIREIRLPALMMDGDFKRIFTTEPGRSVEAVKAERAAMVRRVVNGLGAEEAPDLLLVELYPFGRKAFRFELDPVLADIRSGALPPCKVVCGLRDILVEKKDPDAYEKRVVRTLNAGFDAVLVHADPLLVRLEESFTRVDEILPPVAYTGFVTPKPEPGARERLRAELGLAPDQHFIVGSVGGGSVGEPLLRALLAAFRKMADDGRLQLFTGPFMDDAAFAALRAEADGERIRIARFTNDFLDYLAAADLSVSMAGYNTSMNLMAARVPALVRPFARNREQRLRAERLAAFGGMRILADDDLEPSRLADIMAGMLARRERPQPRLNLNGAAETARWLETHL